MRVSIDVPDYSHEHGLRMVWEVGYEVSVHAENNEVVISANRAGLISLARLLLTPADDRAPSGSHWHLDSDNSLEEGSCEVIIEKK
jgi:hypothetical protein